jgi:hypothetical protein
MEYLYICYGCLKSRMKMERSWAVLEFIRISRDWLIVINGLT